MVIKESAQQAMARFCRQGFGRESIIEKKHQTKVCQSLPLLGMPIDEMTPVFQFDKNFSVELSNKADWKCISSNYNIEKNSIIWFTDGSKTSEGTGAGVFGPRTKYHEPMGNYPSIFQAEVHAIERCAQINLNRCYVNQNIAIMSDSQAAIRAISSAMISSRLVLNCATRLNELGSRNRVKIYWVPGHINIYGNEMADELARRGASTPLNGSAPCGIIIATIKKMIADETHKKWMAEWANLPGCRHSKIALGNFNKRRTEACISLPKNRLRILTGLLTGHCRLRKHLSTMKIRDDDQCRFCHSEQETPLHLLTECLALLSRRRDLLGCYRMKVAELRLISPRSILDFIEACGLLELL